MTGLSKREGSIIFYFHSKRAKGRTVISISNFPISGVEIGGTHIKFEVPGGTTAACKALETRPRSPTEPMQQTSPHQEKRRLINIPQHYNWRQEGLQ